MTEYHSVTPIPNLFIEEILKIDDFEVFPNISKDELEANHDIDFETMNYLQKSTWVSSPIYVRNFKLEGEDDNLENAYHIASNHVRHFINTLVLFQPSVTYIDRGPLWVHPVPKIASGVSGKGDFYGILEIRESERLQLEPSNFNEFRNFFGKCYPYFSSGIKTKLDKYIENSYYWFMKTRASFTAYDRLIFLIVLLESLVGENQELTFRISQRCATILGKDSAQRVQIYEKVKSYYKLRSTILHGEQEGFSKHDLLSLAEVCRTMILRFTSLVLTGYVNDRTELMKKLDHSSLNDELRKEILDNARKEFSEISDPQFS